MVEERSRLIVGLGNPGDAYRLTRHNMGFMVVERLATVHGILMGESKFDVVFGPGKMGDRPIILAKPMTFMNRVGPAITDLTRAFSLDAPDILVIHDDVDIVFGKLKIKEKGGDGGHNGVKSLIEACGTDAFARVRVGIGRPQGQQEVSAYVLDAFNAHEAALLDHVVSAAGDAVETVLFKGVSEAMNQFHGRTISENDVGRRL
jgi:PTH1 family peptidyl-tRNA hydrolase